MDFLLKYQAEYEYSYVIYIGRGIKGKKSHILLRRTFSTHTETQRGREKKKTRCDLCDRAESPPKEDGERKVPAEGGLI